MVILTDFSSAVFHAGLVGWTVKSAVLWLAAKWHETHSVSAVFGWSVRDDADNAGLQDSNVGE